MSDYNYWEFVCRLKNYYYGTRNTIGDSRKELFGRIDWFNKYFILFNNHNSLQEKELPDLKRGDVVLVELGFNIGMEFGGKHYCVVLRNSYKDNKRVTILPLTSQKPSDYEINKDTFYIQFDDIKFLHRKKDKYTGYGRKRWANILNIRTISKSRIIYPNDRDLPSDKKRMSKRHMRLISERIVSQIAIMPDLLYLNKKYKNLQNKYNKLQEEYHNLVSK